MLYNPWIVVIKMQQHHQSKNKILQIQNIEICKETEFETVFLYRTKPFRHFKLFSKLFSYLFIHNLHGKIIIC